LRSAELDYVQWSTATEHTSHEWKIVQNPRLLCHKRKTAIVWFDYYTELIYVERTAPGYLDLLEYLNLNTDEAHGEIIGWHKWGCTKHGRIFYYPNAFCKSLNPFFSWKSIRSSSSRTMGRIEAIKEMRYVLDVVFTFPSEVGASELNEYFCWLAFKHFIRELKKAFLVKLGICANLHPWSTQRPLNSHWHIHSLILGMGLLGKTLKQIPIPLTKDQIEKLKELWASSVNLVFGTNYDRLDIHVQWVDLHKESGRRKLLHKIKYMRRKAVVDIANYYRVNKFIDRGFDPQFVEYLLFYQNKTKIFGYWNKISTYANREVPRSSNVCPICVSPMEYYGIELHLPKEYEVLKVNRSGKIYRFNRVGSSQWKW
jgi:hypothetical protein